MKYSKEFYDYMWVNSPLRKRLDAIPEDERPVTKFIRENPDGSPRFEIETKVIAVSCTKVIE